MWWTSGQSLGNPRQKVVRDMLSSVLNPLITKAESDLNKLKALHHNVIGSMRPTAEEEKVYAASGIVGNETGYYLNMGVHIFLWIAIFVVDIVAVALFITDKDNFITTVAVGSVTTEVAGREYDYFRWLLWVQLIVCILALLGMSIIGCVRIPLRHSWGFAIILGGLIASLGATALLLQGLGRHPTANELTAFVWILLGALCKILVTVTVVRNDLLLQNLHIIELVKASRGAPHTTAATATSEKKMPPA